MVDMNVNNITLNADNLNITDIAKALKEEFLSLREESEFYNEEEKKETNVVSSDNKLINTTNNILSDIYETIVNISDIFLNINDNFELLINDIKLQNKESNVVSSDKKLVNTTNNILSDIYEVIVNISDIFLNINDNFELLLNDIKIQNYERTQEMKSFLPDEDFINADIEGEQDINVTMSEEKKKKEMGLKEGIFSLLAIAFGNMVMGMFEGFQKDGIMGLVKSIFNPDTLFSSIGNYAVIGATIGTIMGGAVGTILGGVVGALFGALKHLIESGKLDGVFSWFAENWDAMIESVVDIFIKIYEFIMYDIITPVRIFILENLIKPLTHGILLLQQAMYETYVAMPLDLLDIALINVQKIFNNLKITLVDKVLKLAEFFNFRGVLDDAINLMKNVKDEAEKEIKDLDKQREQKKKEKQQRFEMYGLEHEMVDEGIEKDIQKLKDDKEAYFLKKAEEKVKEEMLADKVREIEERKNLKSNGDVNVTQVMTSSQTTMNTISSSRISK